MSRAPRKLRQALSHASGHSQGPGTLSPSSARLTTSQYSCLACKQRKVRCNREHPCSECVRLQVECVPTSRKPYSPRKRRRAPSDAESSEHQPRAPARSAPIGSSTIDNTSSVNPQRREHRQTQAPAFGQNLWFGLQDEFQEPQPVETPATEEQSSSATEATPLADPTAAFVFGSPGVFNIDLKSTHPQPVHAFVLWQTYLQSVNPLSKVVYAPQVQDLVIQATGNYDGLSAANVALLYAIYAAAVSSLSDEDSKSKLGELKKVLLARYLACTQQALAAAGFMRSTSLVLLQAFTIFLLAARQSYDSGSIWLLSGMAVRMGQRLLATAPSTANGSKFFDSQMRLRVWWQILLIDGRGSQLAGQARSFYADLPEHPLPANLNDSDMNPQMTGAPPPVLDRATEMVFCLIRYEMGDFILCKGKALHDPAASTAQRDAVIDELAQLLREKYLRHLDPAIALHQIAEAGAHAAIDKMRLMVHHPAHYPDKGKSMPQEEHDMLFRTSVNLVRILVTGISATNLAHLMWHIEVYFQLDAVVFMLIESQSQPPAGPLVDEAWELVGAVLCYKRHLIQEKGELGLAVRQLVLRAWEARGRQAKKRRVPVTWAPPEEVADLLAEAQRRGAPHRESFADPESQAGRGDGAGDDAGAEVTLTSCAGPTDPLASSGFGAPTTELAVPSNLAYPTGTAPAFDGPFSSYADMDVLGWETTDWDSWDYWNTLLQGQVS